MSATKKRMEDGFAFWSPLVLDDLAETPDCRARGKNLDGSRHQKLRSVRSIVRSSGLASYLVAADDFRVLGFGRATSEAVHLRREDVPAPGGALPVAGADVVAPAPATAPPAPGPAEGAATATLLIAAAAAPAAAATAAAALVVSAVLLSAPIAHVRKSEVGVTATKRRCSGPRASDCAHFIFSENLAFR